jgi:hypothetical protein
LSALSSLTIESFGAKVTRSPGHFTWDEADEVIIEPSMIFRRIGSTAVNPRPLSRYYHTLFFKTENRYKVWTWDGSDRSTNGYTETAESVRGTALIGKIYPLLNIFEEWRDRPNSSVHYVVQLSSEQLTRILMFNDTNAINDVVGQLVHEVLANRA